MSKNSLVIVAKHIHAIAKQTKRLQAAGVKHNAKADRTVVTKTDYFVQCAVTDLLLDLTPQIPLVAEETLDGLLKTPSIEAELKALLSASNSKRPISELLTHATHEVNQEKFWVLDPIDGTRGFIRGDQYAIALGLVQSGTTRAGILSCPKLPFRGGCGVTLVASEDDIMCMPFDDNQEISSYTPPQKEGPTVLTESLELGPATETVTTALKTKLNWRAPTLRLDSQAKYGAIATGQADIYLRLPRNPGAVEYSWDHAAGAHLIQAVGGLVTDIDGLALDFSVGSTLANNRGVLATRGIDHGTVVKSLKEILDEL